MIETIRSYRQVLDSYLNPLGYQMAAHYFDASAGSYPGFVQLEWILHHPKATIAKALRTALKVPRDRRIRRNLESDLERLRRFVPEETIPEQIAAFKHLLST